MTNEALQPYVSTAAQQFAPGNFVTTWNPELGRNAVGVTRAIADVTEANPLVLVKWLHDLSEEFVRSEYLYVAADIDAEALRAALVIDSGRLNTNKTQRIAAIQSEIVRAMTRTSTKAPREWFSDLNDLVSKGLSAVKQDAEDERTLNMTRPEIEAELSKAGETFAGAVAQTDAAIMRGIAEAQMRKAIQAWLKCPAEKRPSAFSLGHQIEQAALDFIRAELRTTNR